MSDKPDVAALTDEQCDAIREQVLGTRLSVGTSRHDHNELIRAGRASLQANVPADDDDACAHNWQRGPDCEQCRRCGDTRPHTVPADVAALIAELRECHLSRTYGALAHLAADALQSQQERIAELERERTEYLDGMTHYQVHDYQETKRANAAEAENAALRADAVPREPTRRMIQAVLDVNSKWWEFPGGFGAIWIAMYDAARTKIEETK